MLRFSVETQHQTIDSNDVIIRLKKAIHEDSGKSLEPPSNDVFKRS